MKRYGKEVRLFFDMDGAGQKAARKSAELALEKELIVTLVAIPFGKDAADMGQDDPEKLREMVAQAIPAQEYFLSTGIAKHDITTALGKRQVVDEYVTLLQAVKNPIERAEAIKALARAIDMDERLITGMVSKIFLEQSRRDGPAPLRAPEDPFRDKHTFGKRSELLRDELIALMFVDDKIREHLRERISEQHLQFFFEQHPLFFFLVQAGDRDPLVLIEDQNLKKEVARLSFHILESPEVAGVAHEEREKILVDMAERYLADLYTEVTKREKLISLEKALDEARAKNDKELEKRILTEFVAVSGGGQTPLPS